MTGLKEKAHETTGNNRHFEGKYLTFVLGNEVYGLEILKVQEIMGMMSITRVPKTPSFIRGVINLRGRVIPVMDMRKRFELQPREDTDRTCIIVVMIQDMGQPVTMGLLVDEVLEVVDIKEENLEETPSFGSDINMNFIMCVGKIESGVVLLLDIDRICTKVVVKEGSEETVEGEVSI